MVVKANKFDGCYSQLVDAMLVSQPRQVPHQCALNSMAYMHKFLAMPHACPALSLSHTYPASCEFSYIEQDKAAIESGSTVHQGKATEGVQEVSTSMRPTSPPKY